jgi:hypothetical protein
MPCVGFEPTIPASEQAKTVHTLDSSATVSGCTEMINQILNIVFFLQISPYLKKRGHINAT